MPIKCIIANYMYFRLGVAMALPPSKVAASCNQSTSVMKWVGSTEQMVSATHKKAEPSQNNLKEAKTEPKVHYTAGNGPLLVFSDLGFGLGWFFEPVESYFCPNEWLHLATLAQNDQNRVNICLN